MKAWQSAGYEHLRDDLRDDLRNNGSLTGLVVCEQLALHVCPIYATDRFIHLDKYTCTTEENYLSPTSSMDSVLRQIVSGNLYFA